MGAKMALAVQGCIIEEVFILSITAIIDDDYIFKTAVQQALNHGSKFFIRVKGWQDNCQLMLAGLLVASAFFCYF
jgi:hypothetical protein